MREGGSGGGGGQAHIRKEFGTVRTADNPKSLTADKTANLT